MKREIRPWRPMRQCEPGNTPRAHLAKAGDRGAAPESVSYSQQGMRSLHSDSTAATFGKPSLDIRWLNPREARSSRTNGYDFFRPPTPHTKQNLLHTHEDEETLTAARRRLVKHQPATLVCASIMDALRKWICVPLNLLLLTQELLRAVRGENNFSEV
jgi:hypothetical protein